VNTYPIVNAAGRVTAFEVDNVYASVCKITALLRSTSGVEKVRVRRLFHRPPDVHIRFSYLKTDFVVWEPYADNSRYWIGPDRDIDIGVDVTDLERAFRQYDPPFLVKLVGDLLSFTWLSRKPSR
jgi:hypothetical protein